MSKLTSETVIQVDVQIACDDAYVPEAADISSWLHRAVAAARRDNAAEVSVRIVDAEEIQTLNREYRQQDRVTNVLSFAADTVIGLPDDVDQPLGDIVICASVVSAEAEAQGKTVADHWAHMLVHGTLHLLGFDHETDAEAAAMKGLEMQVLAAHGVANPYGESPQET